MPELIYDPEQQNDDGSDKSQLTQLSDVIVAYEKEVGTLHGKFYHTVINLDAQPSTVTIEPNREYGLSNGNFKYLGYRWGLIQLANDIQRVEVEIAKQIAQETRDANEYTYLATINRTVGEWLKIQKEASKNLKAIADTCGIVIDEASIIRAHLYWLPARLRKNTQWLLPIKQTTEQQSNTPQLVMWIRRNILQIADFLYPRFPIIKPYVVKYLGHWPLSGERHLPLKRLVGKSEPDEENELSNADLVPIVLNTLYAIMQDIGSTVDAVRRAANLSLLLAKYPEKLPNLIAHNHTDRQIFPEKDVQDLAGKNNNNDSPSINRNSRGSYNISSKKGAIDYFHSSVKSAIETELRNRRTPNQEVIIDMAFKQLKNKVGTGNKPLYNERTLRSYLPEEQRKAIYGELYRQVSVYMNHTIK